MNENTAIAASPEELHTELAPQGSQGMFLESFRECYKLASVFAKSGLIPQQFKGKTEDCAIAIELANRMGVSPLMVMQNLFVVKGKPSWSGQACMTFIKNKFADAKPIYTGCIGTDSRGCYIKATDKDGTQINGTEVTMTMAKNEGWLSNPKWKNMPEQMLAYRAAAFFARIYCPETLMGIITEGEAEDSAVRAEKAPDPFAEKEENN